jgi:YVTN family beta-propeller protein
VGDTPKGVAVNQADDTVYVANSVNAGTVSVINGRTGQRTDDTITVGRFPVGVAVDQADATVYVTNSASDNVSIINGRTGQRTDDTITVGISPFGVAVDQSGTNAGLVYVTNGGSDTVSVIGRVTPSLVAPCGSADDTATINLAVPNLAPGFVMDPSTVTSVTFGTTVFTSGTGLSAAAGNKWELRVPVGTGTVPVTVLLKGSSRTTSAGDFTYGCTPPPSPTPTPPTPAGAPSDIKATPGDNSATITWVAPASSGSYPITDYQAIASPGGRTCLVPAPALSCEITGLTSGTSYTFTVQALTGAGWSPASSPSNSITPTPSPTPTITITGSRDDKRIIVTGTTTELVGKTLRPWRHFQGQTTYTEGIVAITPAADGSFTWKRKTGKKIYVYIAHESTRSNTVIIPAR